MGSSKTTISLNPILLNSLFSSFSGSNKRRYSTALDIPLKKKSLLFEYKLFFKQL
jgi:hypothetical protein